ncbi:methyltransferase [Clostridium botulinum]|uniref:class I SAM-dependent methyltransferase n=1 Tax=Clostridium botulinum TaxID=1491 RepID=UPI0006A50AC1|nr:class I SAM-dependent methyltransferase [Clostridium botulinum]KOC51811.1 methyltransferase [Clostridium botulinum]KOC54117.1 methyltransferase [Clostridium botulinum]
MKLKLSGVMETLLIPLYVRAKDAISKTPIINDKKAAEIIKSIEYDFSKFESGWMTYYGTLARVKTMDMQARKFIEKNPDCVIVSIGCGLDTRFSRIDNGKIHWYNLDFPEVIEQRKLFFQENERVKNIAKSALDPTWTKEVETNGKKLLIISEGVLMYFKPDEVKEFLEILTSGFNSFEAHFDMIYKLLVNKGNMHDTVKKTNAQFYFGVKDGSEIVKLCPKLKQLGLINFTDELKHILPGAKKLLTPFFYLTNDRLCIYGYENTPL